MSEHRSGSAGSPTAALSAVSAPGQAARVAWRWTMAYTQPSYPPRGAGADPGRTSPRRWSRRAARELLAVAARPGLWLANLLFVARHGPEVVVVGVAAACVPNPVRAGRGRRALWPVLGLVAAAVVAALVVAALLLRSSPEAARPVGRPAVTGLTVLVGAGLGTLLLAVAHLGMDRRGAVPDRLLHRYAAELARAVGRPVVVGTSFGAWPRGTGDGTTLLAAVLAELRADRVGLLVAARDDRVAAWYAAHGGRSIHPGQPRVLVWLP